MELERCVALAEAAKAAGMLVCAAHVEGMARRTDANDQASIDGILAIADVVLVIEDSDSDGFFTNYCDTNGLPLLKVGVEPGVEYFLEKGLSLLAFGVQNTKKISLSYHNYL